MSLFSIKDLDRPPPANISRAITFKGKTTTALGKVNKKVDQVMSMPAPGHAINFVSLGDWSTHDLLFFYLLKTGPANVYFTTWSISEFAMRQLYQYVNDGLILSLSGLFDYRNGIHKPAELQFLKQITSDIKPSKCHAKIVVISNENHGLAIVTSGNFTRNPRIESGTVFNDPDIAQFHIQWITEELKDGNPFEKD
jgi:hypothetical protein